MARRALFRLHHEPGKPANAGTRRVELVRTLGIVVLAALMGLTSWVVASISTWLVPVYVTAMILIFAMPQIQHLEEPEPADELADVSAERVSKASSPARLGPDSPGARTLEDDGSPKAAATGTKPPGSTTAKRRQPRARGRKPVKPGLVPIVATGPADWIRIGPGKFVRADSQDQGYASAPIPYTTLEAAEASIEVIGSPLDLVEGTSPTAVSTKVDVPIWADLDEPGPSSVHGTPSEEPAASTNLEPDSSVAALVMKADVARQVFDSNTAPATIAIDGDFPAALIVAELVTEEYGIAPSAFGPSLLEASLEEDHGQGWTDLPNSTGTGTRTSAGERDDNKNRCDWMRIKLQSGLHTASSCRRLLEMPQRLQNVRSLERRQGFVKPGRAANCHAHPIVQRNLGRSSRAHRGYQPRSPPERS